MRFESTAVFIGRMNYVSVRDLLFSLQFLLDLCFPNSLYSL